MTHDWLRSSPRLTTRRAVARGRYGGLRAWVLRTCNSAVVLHLGVDDVLLMPYWGRSGDTDRVEDYLPSPPPSRPSPRSFQDGQPVAFPVYGDASFKEPCLLVSRDDGSRIVRLRYVEDRDVADDARGPGLDLVFEDDLIGVHVTLRFIVLQHPNVIVRSTSVLNKGSQPLTLERVLSGALPLPPGDYDAWTLHGQWGREFELTTRPLVSGKYVSESRRGISSHEAHPWFAVRPRGESSEHVGSAWFGSLAWSGNWFVAFETERNDALNIVMGLQPFDFSWRLDPGDRFESPELISGYTEEGLSGVSRALHAFEEQIHLPANQRQHLRPVLFNSWEAVAFDVGSGYQLELARRAANLGVELFVVDDGWFGARNNDHAGLGDWTVNSHKLPGGLRPLVDAVHDLGMQFGIWVEPEMVNPDSDLYRAHPDWAYHAEGREPTYDRNQLVLNFARADVRDAIYAQLIHLLTEHGRIDFLKWDHNRVWTEVGWPEEPGRQREVWVRHVQGVYDMLSRLREDFPRLVIETCAGGGSRADLGILRYTDQAWTSDNTDAVDRLTIQYGYSRAHSPRTMVNWVTDSPNKQTGRTCSLEFRFHVAMQGVLGLGGDIGQWSDADLVMARRLVDAYKGLRPIIQHGHQYWLLPPAAIGPCAVQYVTPDANETVVCMYQVRGLLGRGVRSARLRGLVADRRYQRENDGAESTGAALMSAGIPLDLSWGGLDPLSRIEVWRVCK